MSIAEIKANIEEIRRIVDAMETGSHIQSARDKITEAIDHIRAGRTEPYAIESLQEALQLLE